MAALIFLCAGRLIGQERRPPEKLQPGSSCVAKECHGPLAERAVIHDPVAKKTCDACHEQDDEALHKFTYPDRGSELCYGCHKSATKNKALVHAPLKDAKRPCLRCHDPHSTAAKHLVRAKTTTTLCLECHAELGQGERFHTSRAVGGCTGCHEPHASDAAKLIRAKQPDLCYTCHEDTQEDAAKAKTVHGPLGVGCTPCHDPHRPMAGQGLKQTGAGLCMTCHEHFKGTLAAMSKRHPLLLEDKDCLRCHGPHFGPQKALLRRAPLDLCLACHDKDVTSGTGRLVKGLAAQLVEGAGRHGPLAAQQCAGCHEPHGNDQTAFLRGAYPATFYSPYASDTYALCFRCHDPGLAENRHTVGDTKFRDGNVNLHYLHVNKTEKGRSCRVCHVAHATKLPHLLRDSVPFGKWRLPIGFSQTKDGGTCASGCHLPKSYSRTAPVAAGASPATKPATRPAAPATSPAPPAGGAAANGP